MSSSKHKLVGLQGFYPVELVFLITGLALIGATKNLFDTSLSEVWKDLPLFVFCLLLNFVFSVWFSGKFGDNVIQVLGKSFILIAVFTFTGCFLAYFI